MKNNAIRKSLIRKGRTLKTYNQWKRLGYYVMKGQKSPCRTRVGVALFSDLQVCRYDFEYEYAMDMQELADRGY